MTRILWNSAFVISTAALAQPVPTVLLDTLKNSVVRIEAGDQTGAGVVLHMEGDTAQVLTAFHVVGSAGGNGISVTFRGDSATVWRATVVGRTEIDEYDLALLRVEKSGAKPPTAPPTVTVRRDPQQDDVVFAIGHDGDNAWMHTDAGRVTRATDSIDIASFRFTDRGVRSGYSGGPVFNARGELVGITMQTDEETAQALKIETALEVVRSRFGSSLLNRLDIRRDDPGAEEELRRKLTSLQKQGESITGFFERRRRQAELAGGHLRFEIQTAIDELRQQLGAATKALDEQQVLEADRHLTSVQETLQRLDAMR
jgi:S1-C subfamily serine protease